MSEKNISDALSRLTAEKRELEKQLEREHFIVSCIIALHKHTNIDIAMNGLLEMTGKFFQVDRVYVFVIDEDNTISNTHEWCNEGIKPQIDTLQRLDISLIDRWRESFDKRQCVIIENVDDIKDISPSEYAILKRQEINSLLVSPLDENGKLIGFLGIDNPSNGNIREGEIFFEALSYFVSSTLSRKINEKKLKSLSFTDTLTKLYNRNKFTEDVKELSKAYDGGIGILYMDLNGLKAINDNFGHDTGDSALIEIAGILKAVFGRAHSYRIGGDEFVALYPCDNQEEFIDRFEALKTAVEKSEYNSAIGYYYADSCKNIDRSIKIADENMYLDKKYFYRNQKSSNRYRFRNDTFVAISTPELLKNLINDERFIIWFQPRFNTTTRSLCGSEALIRFFDEDNVLVSPMDFVPEMEANSTIHLIDFYVFRHVCKYISRWLKEGKEVKPVSINMSHQTMLYPGFIENLMNIWYDYNVPKELLIIEVSENPDNNGIADVMDVLSDLKKHGFKIAIDNFGSKYADLFLFSGLKFDILKLDGDLVYKIKTDDRTRILSMSISQICHNQNIKIVAEGVESEDELSHLIEMGCDEAQGYFFDKPMPWNKFEEKYLK